MAVDGQGHGEGAALEGHGLHDQEDGSHADDLLGHLGKGRDAGALHPVIISVDTGMEGREGDRQGDDQEIGGAAGFQEEIGGDKAGPFPYRCRQPQREGKGDRKAGEKDGPSSFLLCRHMLGQGGLDRSGTDGEADPEHRMDHVIDAKALRSDRPGQEDAIEKTKDAAQEPSPRKEQGPGEESTFFRGQRRQGLVHGDSKRK